MHLVGARGVAFSRQPHSLNLYVLVLHCRAHVPDVAADILHRAKDVNLITVISFTQKF